MADSALYPKWKEALLQNSADSDLDGTGATGTYAALIDTGTYTYSAAHQYYSSLAGVIGTDVELGTKTYADGYFDAADSTWTGVSGASVEAIAIYRKNAGANTTWRLVAYIDGASISVTPNGGNIVAQWNASGIFKL